MKSVTRILPAFIAIASLVFLANCTKDSQNTLNDRSISDVLQEELSSSGNTSTSGSNMRIMTNSTVVTSVPALCGSTTRNFIGSTNHGNITVGNDATNYYFTINGTDGWIIKRVRMYIGSLANIPVNNGGLPLFNDYPIDQMFSSPYPATWSFSVPAADLGNDFWVSVRIDYAPAAGGASVSVWSEGDPFKSGNPASRFNVLWQECITDRNEGCAFGQGYWFGNGNQSWPDMNGDVYGNVTIGGENYSRDEARAIWWANNGNCPGIPDAKKAFAFVSAITLSGSNVVATGDFWNDISTVDSWLESLDRLSDVNICNHPSAPANVKEAVARIGAWMDEHKCE